MTAAVEFSHVYKEYNGRLISKNITFSLKKGDLIGILGTSGSGKTTLLRMLAGLENPSKGDIYINGQLVTHKEPGQRDIGFLFQNYALFKHMTIRENIAFGMEMKKYSKKAIKERVDELAQIIQLEDFLSTYPMKLSGGQRQRVAFARALAPHPQLLLLDEPFAAIDAKVRKELRHWLRQTITRLGITSIFVTHDQEEAIEVADELLVIHKGRLEQQGSPVTVYTKPASPFVASFMGHPTLIRKVKTFAGFQDVPYETAFVRPECIELSKEAKDLPFSLTTDQGQVKDCAFRGSHWEVDIEVHGQELKAIQELDKPRPEVGSICHIFIHRLYGFNQDTVELIENKAKTTVESIFI